MSVFFKYFLIGCFIGPAVTRQADIDINRVKLVSNEAVPAPPEYTNHPRRYPEPYSQYKRSYDYDYRSGGHAPPLSAVQSLQSLHGTSEVPAAKTIAVYQPREDPRLFYQSSSYLKEIDRKNLIGEASSIYPGREVVRAGKTYGLRSLETRRMDRNANMISPGYKNVCVKCPQDRTLIAKPGSDMVVFQYPRLTTCSGLKVPRDVRFIPLYGPKFGSLLTKGSHIVIGHISYKNKDIQMCKMEVHVIVQNCAVPSYLISKCDEKTKVCNFSCRDPNMELQGHTTLSCGDTMGWTDWTGALPVCRARTWCERPLPPDNGRLSCKGLPEGTGLAEGSTCRVRCARGWHWSPRAATVCRRGAWTFNITCQRRSNHSFGG
ncbi:uncharacterized protein LOC114349826 [Ostrinia furnacalis]|uniref:uncharacterized protein LOC114349826 n=1 Tax=Ostrinia furnacalis TaxID=93504 RepID=UPI00103E319D|nr:uncharacterized protein LOC114349826 [Ostrinia furnacalis]